MLESKRRAIIFLSISFALALVAGYLFLEKVESLNSSLGGMTEVYIAKTDIPSRTLITPENLTTMELPNKFVKESKDSYVTDINEVINHVFAVPVSKGGLITQNNIKELTSTVDENNRMVHIYQSGKIFFDFSQGAIKPGDRVDIIVSHSLDGKPVTETFMKEVIVNSPLGNEDKVFTGIQVEIKAEDAPKLIHMQNYADSMRILKANVAQTVTASKPVEKNPEAAEEKTESKATEEKPAATEQPAAAEQPETNPQNPEENTTPEG